MTGKPEEILDSREHVNALIAPGQSVFRVPGGPAATRKLRHHLFAASLPR
jgi:hypothetical protein